MTKNEIVTHIVSGAALVIAVAAWYTSDTRANELKRKVIKYSVDATTVGGSFSGPGDESKTDKSDSVSQAVVVDIVNDGSLPVSGVTLSIAAQTAFERTETAVELKPSVDHEIVPQGNVTVVRFKNPLGPKDHVSATVTFTRTIPAGRQFYEAIKLTQAYVDSEVGQAILVASLGRPSRGGEAKY
jgi:hypothetical protein